MYTTYLDMNPARAMSVRALGRASRRIYFSPLAPLRSRRMGAPVLPGSRWARVRNIAAGIAIDEARQVITPVAPGVSLTAEPLVPRIYLGRAVIGEIIELGPGAQYLREGDRVVYQSGSCCATYEIEPPCAQCARGAYALCENRFHKGPQQIGGGWGDEMVVHERQLFLAPDGLSIDQGAMLEPTAAALRAALRCLPQPDEHVLVLGAEPHGLLITQSVRAMVPLVNLTVAPEESYQVEVATRMGATGILYPEDGIDAAARLTGATIYRGQMDAELLTGGFDIVYDTIGTEQSVRKALTWAREGGVVVLAARADAWMRLDLSGLWRREVTLMGAYAHGAETWPSGAGDVSVGGGGRESTFALAATLLREGRLTPERLVTHRFPLREIRVALETVRDRVEHRTIQALIDVEDTGPAVAMAENSQPIFGTDSGPLGKLRDWDE